jgi:hypothetical protein
LVVMRRLLNVTDPAGIDYILNGFLLEMKCRRGVVKNTL